MNSNRPTRRVSKSTRSSSEEEVPVRRRPRRTARAVEESKARPELPPRRKRTAKPKRSLDEPKAPDIARRSKARKPPPSEQTIILAMSPNAANILRAMLGRARHDEPELEAIRQELESQLA